MHEINLIIFDLDGTLVESRQDIADAVNFTLRELGLKEKGLDEISSYIGTGVEDLIQKSLGGKDGSLLEKGISVFTEYYKKHFLDTTHLYPDTKETMEYYKAKRKVIVTNRKYEFAVDILKGLDIYDYFEDVIGGDNLGCMKPSSCPLHKMMRKFKIDKDKTIIVGDMDIDILAGKKSGIMTCAATYGIGAKEDILKAKPDYVINRLSELKGIIR